LSLQEFGSQAGIGSPDALSFCAEGLTMESKPQQPQYPIVPLASPTQLVNIVLVEFIRGNYGIQLTVGELRTAPVQSLGEPARSAIFEAGRFALTPRALRNLLDKAQAAAKAYEEAVGTPLPTESQFLAGAVIPTLLQAPKPPENEGPSSS
jgi:hypothetical protein